MFILLTSVLLFSETQRPLAFVIREHVYQAEVYGRREEGIAALQGLWLSRTEIAERYKIARAISVIKGGSVENERSLAMESLDAGFQPGAMVRFGMPALLVNGSWLEPGDWIDDYFVLDVEPEQLILERRDGFRRELPLQPLEPGVNAVFRQADARGVLGFIARRQGLNAFVPSQIEQTVSGSFMVNDWLSFMDNICSQTGLIWIRRSGNVIFSRRGGDANQIGAAMIKSEDRRNQSLNSFLQNLALTFNMELILDEELEDVDVDILLMQDQSWDEVLECLSIMNGFSWFVVRDPGESPRLFIQTEREE